MTDTRLFALANEIADMRRQIKRMSQPQLAYSAIENGSISEYAEDQLVQIIGEQYDGTHVAAAVAGPTPPQPSTPSVVAVAGGLEVTWNGLFAVAGATFPFLVAPMDFARVDVVVSTAVTPDFIATAPSHVFTSPRGGKVFLALPQVVHKIALVTRTEAGVASVPSASVAEMPLLVSMANLELEVANSITQAQTDAAAAQTSAASAQTTAASAQTAATQATADALAASGLAGTAQTTADSKGKVIFQVSAPTGANADVKNLWINTSGTPPLNKPYQWSGTAWVAITDKAALDAAAAAATAQTRADQAFNDAASAATSAGNAQTTANGKNRVWYQATDPAGTGHAIGDIVFRTDLGNKPRRWTGTAWTDAAFGDAAIANLDAGKITTGFLDVANRLQAGAVTARELSADTAMLQKLTVAQTGGALVANGTFQGTIGSEPPGWARQNGTATMSIVEDTTAPNGSLAGVLVGNGTNTQFASRVFAVTPGKVYVVRLAAKHSNGVGTYHFRMGQSATFPASGYLAAITVGAYSVLEDAASTLIPNWTDKVFVWTCPTGVSWASFVAGNYGTSTGNLQLSGVDVREQIVSAVIGDGAILANNIRAEAITGDKIKADAITARELDAYIILANTITTSIAGARVQFDTDGFTAFRLEADGITETAFFTVNPKDAIVVADCIINARQLTVTENASLGGLIELAKGGVFRMTKGTTPPANPPTVTVDHQTLKFVDDAKWGDRLGWATDGTYWYTVRNANGYAKIEKWSAAGALVLTSPDGQALSGGVGGVAVYGGNVFLLSGMNVGFGAVVWTVYRFGTTLLNYLDQAPWNNADGNRLPAFGADPATGQLLIAQSRVTDDKVRIRHYTYAGGSGASMTAGTFIDTGGTDTFDLTGVSYGDFDYGSARYVYARRGGASGAAIRVRSATGAIRLIDEWQQGSEKGLIGLTWNGTAFVSMDASGRMRTYTGISQDAIFISNTLRSSTAINTGGTAGAETGQSPRAKLLTGVRRGRINWSVSPIQSSGNSNDPKAVSVYVGAATGVNLDTDPGRAAMARQALPIDGKISGTLTSLTLPTSASNPAPPTLNDAMTFEAGVHSRFEMWDGQLLIGALGELPASPLRTNVDNRVTALAPTVTMTSGDVGTGAFKTSVKSAVTRGDIGLARGYFTGNCDSSNNVTVQHPLGVAPASITFGADTAGTYAVVGAPLANNFTVKCRDAAGTVRPVGFTVSFYWTAVT